MKSFIEWWEEEWRKDNYDVFYCMNDNKRNAEWAWNAALENQWQPIETAPRDGTPIIVYFKPHGALTVTSDGERLWQVDDFKNGPFTVRGYMEGDDTHWMPRPKDPT